MIFTFMLWLQFILTVLLVICCGYITCAYAEKIARLTKMSKAFLGFMFLAVVTSLPELTVAITGTKIGALDLVVGNLFGSNLFNLAVIGIIFLGFTKRHQTIKLDVSHFMSSGFSLLFIALAAIGIVFYRAVSPGVAESSVFVDAETALILVIYAYGAYTLFHADKDKGLRFLIKEQPEANSALVWSKFIAYCLVLIAAGVFLTNLAVKVSAVSVNGIALSETFVGTCFLAICASLPEMVVCVTAARMGSFDLALGNIFGSNMFNMAILGFCDVVLGRTVILSSISILHLFTALFVIVATALVMASLVYRSQAKVRGLALDAVSVIFIFFAANMLILYLR